MSDGSTVTESTADTPLRQTLRLTASELRLFARESHVWLFVIGFPIVTVLVLGGVFGTAPDDEGFEFVNPSHFYVAAYFGVVLSAIGFVMMPAHVAASRSEGVLRRYDTAGFPRWTFPVAQLICGIVFAAVGFGALLVTASLSNGVPAIHDPGRMLPGLAAGTVAFISLGVALGMVLPSGRAAQAFGLTLFFPMFLLSGGGPPPQAMSDTMRSISSWLPLTHVIRAVQEPWLNLGSGSNHLVVVVAIAIVSAAVWVWRAGQVAHSA